MSVQALAWAYSREIPPEMNPTDRFVLVTLANFADDQGRAWPSLATLARSTNLHRVTVARSIGRLETVYGAVSKLRSGGGRQGRSNVYKLQMGALQLTRELAEHEHTRSFDEPVHDELIELLTTDSGPVDNPSEVMHSATRDGMHSATRVARVVAESDKTCMQSATRPVREQSITPPHAHEDEVVHNRPCHGGHIDAYGDPVACGLGVTGCSAFKIDEDTKIRGRLHIEEMRERLGRKSAADEQAPKGAVR